jgi:uncharacterized membrane protein YphA (DoxX/SURF4 family)
MKGTNIAYWIITGLLLALMLFSGVSSFLDNPQKAQLLEHMHITDALLKFTGIAKVLAVIAILIPGFPRLKEWAYAGLTYDLIGALFLGLAAGDTVLTWLFVIVALLFVFLSYYLYHKRLKASGRRRDTVSAMR